MLFKKIIFSFFIFSFFCPISLKAQEDFPWEMFLPAITSKPRCDSKNLSLCQTVSDCYYNSGYWYFNKCNSTPIASNSLKYILIDGKLVTFKINDAIYYKINVSGNFLNHSSNGQCVSYYINQNGNGSTRYGASVFNDFTDQQYILRQTVNLYINSRLLETRTDFYQDSSNSFFIVHDTKNSYHNWPNGIAWIKSPMNVGLSWNFDYYTNSQLPESSLVKFIYHHKGNYKILTKEIVSLDVGKFEAFKVYYSYEGDSVEYCLDCLNKESGYIWYYPKIGIIKADLTVGSFMDWPCFGYYKLKYEMTGSNLLKNNLPRE